MSVLPLTHFRLNKPSLLFRCISEEYKFSFRYVRLCDLDIARKKMAKLFVNSGDPNQMPHTAASVLGLHCLLVALFGVSRFNLDKVRFFFNSNKLM